MCPSLLTLEAAWMHFQWTLPPTDIELAEQGVGMQQEVLCDAGQGGHGSQAAAGQRPHARAQQASLGMGCRASAEIWEMTSPEKHVPATHRPVM